jgi:hypothetical protein
LGRWSRCRKLAVFIIGTNVGQRDNWPAGSVPRTVVLVNPDLAADKALRYLFGRLLRAC